MSDAVATFGEKLGPFGTWIETDRYGTVWQPAGVGSAGSNWRPYTDGAWADSEQGWVWQSHEPFGDICYHYGRWALLSDCGWVWVPGYEWAPAWVAWRADDTYAGWAPLPPEFSVDYIDNEELVWEGSDYAPEPSCYNFVSLSTLGDDNCREVLLLPSLSASLFARTHSFTHLHRDDHHRICNSDLRDRHPEARSLRLRKSDRKRADIHRHARSSSKDSQHSPGVRRSVSSGGDHSDRRVAPSKHESIAKRRQQEEDEIAGRKRAAEAEVARRRADANRRKNGEEENDRRRRAAEADAANKRVHASKRKQEEEENDRRRRASEAEEAKRRAEASRRKKEEEENSRRRRAAEEAKDRARQEADRRRQADERRERDEKARRDRERAEEARRRSDEDARRSREESSRRSRDRSRR